MAELEEEEEDDGDNGSTMSTTMLAISERLQRVLVQCTVRFDQVKYVGEGGITVRAVFHAQIVVNLN